MSRPSKLYRRTLPLVALGIVVLLVCNPRSTPGPQAAYRDFLIGVVFGTVFGQTTVIAVWTTLGPAALRFRLAVAAVWLGLLLASILIGFRGGPNLFEGVTLFSAALGAQWLLAQLPLWLLVWVYRSRLDLETGEQAPGTRPQFGLRQLMSFTALIAVLLGAGRLIVASELLQFQSRELPVFLFLAGTAVLVSLPPVLAALLPRRALLSVLAVISLSALLTAGEFPVLQTFAVLHGPKWMHIVSINFFTCAWALTFAAAARLAGYRLRAMVSRENH